jgi:hypothetical protein
MYLTSDLHNNNEYCLPIAAHCSLDDFEIISIILFRSPFLLKPSAAAAETAVVKAVANV